VYVDEDNRFETTTLEQVNEKLEQMGYNIGLRLIDDFLAKSGLARCGSFKETAEAVSRVGFKMFLNLTPVVKDWNEKGSSCSLEFTDNPLEMFVELPDSCAGLKYSNMLCGVLRGALESVSLNVESTVISDALQGDTKTVLSLSLKNVIEDAANEDYRDD